MAHPLPLRPEVVARAIAEIERFLPAGPDPLVPLAEGDAIPLLFRFPSPRGILNALDRDAFALTPPDVDAAFAGDLETSFAYPWVQELGTIALLDPLGLGFHRVRARPGWFVADGARIVPSDEHLYVPVRAMAERLRVGMRRDDALDAIGRQEWQEAVAERRARLETYVAELPRLDARCRELLAVAERHRDGVRAKLAPLGLDLDRLRGPLFALDAAQRAALLELHGVG